MGGLCVARVWIQNTPLGLPLQHLWGCAEGRMPLCRLYEGVPHIPSSSFSGERGGTRKYRLQLILRQPRLSSVTQDPTSPDPSHSLRVTWGIDMPQH